jgi:hypothetical protein
MKFMLFTKLRAFFPLFLKILPYTTFDFFDWQILILFDICFSITSYRSKQIFVILNMILGLHSVDSMKLNRSNVGRFVSCSPSTRI